jgi:hypothetical protein
LKHNLKTYLVALLTSILWVLPARSAEVAVLDFDGFGLSYDDTALVSQGFRDAFLEEGRFFPLEGYDISDRLGSGKEEALSRARYLVAEARSYLNSGRAMESLGMLEEAEELHRSAGSHHARRAQLADVYFFLGQAQLRLGRSQAANETFVKMLKTYPGYAETRAGSVPSSVNSAMARAKTVRINQSRDLMDAGSADNMARRLRVQAVVSGVVDGNGQLAVRLFRGGRIEGEINRRLDTLPPFPGDPIYLEMVQQLMLNLGASSGRDGGFASPPDFGGASGRDGFQDAPSFDSGSGPVSSGRTGPTGQMPEEDSGPGLPESLGKDRRPWWKFWGSKDAKPVTGRINVGGRSPLAENWWVWAAGGAVVAGGGVAAVLLLNSSGGVAQSATGSSYTLTIETE